MEGSGALDSHFVERRRYGRLLSHFDVDVVLFSGKHAGDQISGKAINVSKEGIGAILRSNISPGTRVELTIFSEIDPSFGSGEIIWRKVVKNQTIHGIKILRWPHLDPSMEFELPH